MFIASLSATLFVMGPLSQVRSTSPHSLVLQIDHPSTAFAFGVLNFFHKLRSQNKCNEYDSHHTTIQRTDAVVLNREIVLFQNIFSSSPYNSSIP